MQEGRKIRIPLHFCLHPPHAECRHRSRRGMDKLVYAGFICRLETSKVTMSNHHFRRADDKDTTTHHMKLDVYKNASIV